MLRYEIEGGRPPVVICHPEVGQPLCTEHGAMSRMSTNVQMAPSTGGGSAQILLHDRRTLRISDRQPDDSDAERPVPMGLIVR